MTVFGPLVTGLDVRHAVLDTIRWWSPTYLAEVGRRAGLGDCALDAFRSYSTPGDLEQLSSMLTPGCSVIDTGFLEQPEETEDGLVLVHGVEVTVFVSADDVDTTNDLSSLYFGAVAWLLVQQKDLGRLNADGDVFTRGAVRSTRLVDADPPDFDTDSTYGGRTGLFAVTVEDAMDPHAGPRVPAVDPCEEPADEPLAEEFVVIEHQLDD